MAVGDRVAIDPALMCGRCRYCRTARGNLCADWNAIGDTVNGAFAEYAVAPANNAYLLPPDLSFPAGALVEPMSCVVRGLHRLSMRPASDLLIVGGGTIGLLLLQAARRSGAATVDVVDPIASRLDRARAFGATAVGTDVAELIRSHGHGYEYVIEATGVGPAAEAALGAVDRGGSLLIFGMAPENVRIEFSPYRIYAEEITVLGTMAIFQSFAPALTMLAAGLIDVEHVVTHQFPIEQFDEALDTMRSRKGLKIQFKFD